MAESNLKIIINGEDRATPAFKKAGESANSLVSGLAKLGGALVLGGIAAAGTAVAGLGAFLFDSVQGAIEAEKISAKLNATLANTGKVTGVTATQVNNLATQWSQMTPYEDDAISSAGEVLARFDTISNDTFPGAMEATLNVASALGVDLNSAALLVGKSLAVPGEGLAKLKAAGVTFTDQEEKQIDALLKAGKTAEAQKLILDSLKGSVGGLAVAAGNTLAGKMEILKNTFGNVKDTIGAALLPALSSLASMLLEKLNDPAIQATIQKIADSIANFAQQVIDYIPQVINWFTTAFDYLKNNQEIIVGILAALGVAVGAFVFTVAIPAIVTLIASIAPIILILAAVGVAAALLYKAWNTNFLGIRDTLTAFWNNTVKPIFEKLKEWLATNIPIAIERLKTFWNDVLLPAIKTVWNWINTVLFPLLSRLWTWLKDTLTAAIQTLTNFWNNTLLPAIKEVWSFINTYLIPLFNSLKELFDVALKLAITALAGLWEKVLQPALKTVYDFLKDKLQPVFDSLGTFLRDTFAPIVDRVKSGTIDALAGAFDKVKGAISGAIGWIDSLIEKLKKITLPDWLKPGSPTPFEIGLRGINSELGRLASKGLPELQVGLRGLNAPISSTQKTSTINNNYYLNANYKYQSERTLGQEIKRLSMVGRA